MIKIKRYALALPALMLLASQPAQALAVLLGDPENGNKLESERCSACHVRMFGGDGSGIYTRPERVGSIEGLMKRVELCNINTQNGELSADQLDDITAHLNETYYLFDD